MSSFSIDRQNKLNPVLAALKAVPGIEDVQQDDWDSASVKVFVWLKQVDKHKMAVPVNHTSRRLKLALKKTGVAYDMDDMPRKRYSDNGPAYGGGRLRFDEGYSTNRVGFTIYV